MTVFIPRYSVHQLTHDDEMILLAVLVTHIRSKGSTENVYIGTLCIQELAREKNPKMKLVVVLMTLDVTRCIEVYIQILQTYVYVLHISCAL